MQVPRRRTRALLLLIAVAAASLEAQAPPAPRASYAFSSWGTAEGLPQTTVVGIAEDRDGYLWIATTSRLARFDGRRFMEVPLGGPAPRGQDRPRALVTDSAGDVWLLRFEAGASRVLPDGRTVRGLAPLPAAPSVLAFGPGDSTWMAGGTQLFLHTGGVWREVPAARLAAGAAHALFVDRDGTAWLGGTSGLARVSAAGVRTWRREHGLPHENVLALAPSPEGGAWVGTEGGYALVRRDGGVERVAFDSGGATRVDAIAIDREGHHWLGGPDGVRLVALERRRDGTLAGRTLFTHPAALGGTGVRVLRLDDAGRLWIGTEGAGLHQLRPLAVARLRRSDGLPSRVVHEVFGDGDGGLWVAGGCMGLVHWRGGVSRTYLPPELGLQSPCVEGLARDRTGGFWIGNRGRFMRLAPDGTRREYVVADGAEDIIVGPFLEDRDGRMWVATAHGLGRVERDGRFVFPLPVAGLDDGRIWSFALDEEGAVWAGQVGAASRIVRDSVVRRLDGRDGVPAEALRALLAEGQGGLWMASYGGGLAHFAPDVGVRRLTRADGLFDDALSAIVRDRADRLWLLGDRGLAVAPRADLYDAVMLRRAPRQAVVFGAQDSMPEGNGGFPNAWLDEDERLWLATVDGVATVDAGAFPFDRTPVRARVDEVRLNGERVPHASGIRVPPGDNVLEFAFSAPNLDATDRLRFRYRLAGHDPEWIESGAERVARYAKVAPGTYAFELVGRNVDGIEAPGPVVVQVEVEPAWWQRAWVRALGVLLLGWGVWRWHRRRLALADARNRVLQREIEERKRAQEEASRAASELAHVSRVATAGELATSLAHELNQPLSAVTTNAQAAQQMFRLGMEEELEPVLEDIVAQSQRAAGVVRSIRAFVRKQAPTMSPVDPAGLAKETLRLLHGELTARGVVTHTEVRGAPPPVRGDTVQLQQVLVNLLLNAADAVRELPAERRGITLTIEARGDDHVVIAVSDLGPGLDAAALARIFEPFYTTKPSGLGMGLGLSRSIVEAHAGALTADSTPGEGTTMQVRLPAWRDE